MSRVQDIQVGGRRLGELMREEEAIGTLARAFASEEVDRRNRAKERDSVREAFRKYGRHTDDCEVNGSARVAVCSCGWSDFCARGMR